MKIKLNNRYAVVPDGTTVIDLSGGNATDAGIIRDRKGILETLVIVSDKSLQRLSVEEEDRLIDTAIKGLPNYIAAKAQELPGPPYDADVEDIKKWEDKHRLEFWPFRRLNDIESLGYRLFDEAAE